MSDLKNTSTGNTNYGKGIEQDKSGNKKAQMGQTSAKASASAGMTNKVQSAGPPGSAGMVGSKRWMSANSGNTQDPE